MLGAFLFAIKKICKNYTYGCKKNLIFDCSVISELKKKEKKINKKKEIKDNNEKIIHFQNIFFFIHLYISSEE